VQNVLDFIQLIICGEVGKSMELNECMGQKKVGRIASHTPHDIGDMTVSSLQCGVSCHDIVMIFTTTYL
jgi:hypothetical protein